MNNKDAHSLYYLLSEMVQHILELADNPGECSLYITSEIRSIIGVKTVALYQKVETASQTYQLISCVPQRREAMVSDEKLQTLFGKIENITTTSVIADNIEDDFDVVSKNTIIVPLYAGAERVGIILLLDLFDLSGISEIVSLLNNLSGVIGLVLRNASLYKDLEEEVSARTHQLQERNQQLYEEIEERKRIAEELVQSEKMMSLGGLAAGMAHEINNPLAGILQNAQVIKQRLFGNEQTTGRHVKKHGIDPQSFESFMSERKIDTMLSYICENGERATQIVDSMLVFAKKSESRMEDTKINQLIDQSITIASHDYDLKKKYDFKKIKIKRQYSSDLPTVVCIRTEITQVLLNIFKNGAHAMMQKRKNMESVLEEYEPEFIITTTSVDSWLQITIEDNGSGIADNIQKRIFEPFFTAKQIENGKGLGLSISYFIILEHHNGEIYVESDGHSYTRFVIKLPLKYLNLNLK